MRLAEILISTGSTEKPDPGTVELLKFEIRQTFNGVECDEIRLIKNSKDCISSPGEWVLEWNTPKPGIDIRCDYTGWSQQRSERLLKLIHRPSVSDVVSDFFQSNYQRLVRIFLQIRMAIW